MFARVQIASVFAALVLASFWTACFREPDVDNMKCTVVKGCPAGYACTSTGAEWRCKPVVDRDASPDSPSLPTSDVGQPDSAGIDGVIKPFDVSALDVTRRDTADLEVIDAPASEIGTGFDGPNATGGQGGTVASGGVSGGGSGGGGGSDGPAGETIDLRDVGGAGGSDASDAALEVGLDVPLPPGPDGGTGGIVGVGGGSGSGGVIGTGGLTGTGGNTVATGGASQGGTPGTGGAVGTGGTPGTGGALGTGGSGTGGSPPGTGGSCSLSGFGGAANALAVDVGAAQAVVNKELFGVIMERLGRNFSKGLFVGAASTIPNTDGMRTDIIDGMKEGGVGLIQFPGGCAANGYTWSTNTSPTNDVGTDRFMELCTLVGAEPYVTGRPTAGDASSNVAWFNYLNSSGRSLKYFKVGSEVWGGCGTTQTEATYETNYTANYTALSSAAAGKPLFLVASNTLPGNTAWATTMVTNIGSQINGIELHDYVYFPTTVPCVGFSDDQYYDIVNRANNGQIRLHLDQLIAVLDQTDPSKHVKIVEDEWGEWLKPFDKASDGWMQQNTVMDAVSAAEHLHVFMEHADRVQIAALAQGINVIDSLFLTHPTSQLLVKTPTFYIFKMFIPHHSSGAKWAPNTLTSENITGGGATFPVLSAGTTVDSQGRINVSLVNVDLVNTRTVQIALNNAGASYAVSSAQVVTGSQKDSYNDFGQAENVNIQTLPASSYAICGSSMAVTLPPKSVVMFVLTPQ